MGLHLPDLGTEFFVTPIDVAADKSVAAPVRTAATSTSSPAAVHRAANAQFSVEPGVWLLTANLSLPDLGKDTPKRYAAALFIGDTVAARKPDASRADSLDVKLAAVGGARKTLQVTLIETDGSAWSAPVVAGSAWSTVTVPFADLHLSRSIHIPTPYPGLWDYWRGSPRHHGGDRIHMEHVERLQLSVGPNSGDQAGDDAKGVAVESIRVRFASGA
jgi:hypothetical protein